MQQQVAGNFEQKVANEKYSGEQAELLGTDAEITVHGKGGEADVDAVQEGDDVQDKNEREDAKLKLTDGGDFDCRWSDYVCLCYSHAQLANDRIEGTHGRKRRRRSRCAGDCRRGGSKRQGFGYQMFVE